MNDQLQIDVTLTHYRCFHETSPVNFSLEPGKMIALVGMNNAGKSALMRFFYEFKQVLINYTSGSWNLKESGGGWTTRPNQSDPGIGTRYGLCDHLDLYPNRDSSIPLRFAFRSLGDVCEFEIFKLAPNHGDGHGLTKNFSSQDDQVSANLDVIHQFQNTLYFGAHRNWFTIVLVVATILTCR